MKQIVFLCLCFLSLQTLNAQTIKVYFNQSVDNTVSSIADAQTSSHLDDTICALINSSNTTLDIAVWDNGSTKIVTALNNAYLRGVQVRYISSTNSFNSFGNYFFFLYFFLYSIYSIYHTKNSFSCFCFYIQIVTLA